MQYQIPRISIDYAEERARRVLDTRANRSITLAVRSSRYGLGFSPAEVDELRAFDRAICKRGGC